MSFFIRTSLPSSSNVEITSLSPSPRPSEVLLCCSILFFNSSDFLLYSSAFSSVIFLIKSGVSLNPVLVISDLTWSLANFSNWFKGMNLNCTGQVFHSYPNLSINSFLFLWDIDNFCSCLSNLLSNLSFSNCLLVFSSSLALLCFNISNILSAVSFSALVWFTKSIILSVIIWILVWGSFSFTASFTILIPRLFLNLISCLVLLKKSFTSISLPNLALGNICFNNLSNSCSLAFLSTLSLSVTLKSDNILLISSYLS